MFRRRTIAIPRELKVPDEIYCSLRIYTLLVLSHFNGDDFLPKMVANRFLQHITAHNSQRPGAAQSRKWQTMALMTRIGS
jgi:hypothetical protein